ncbi:hypothetical protein F4801DRAFT_578977 [Xylaria longipes]|nr:hypothetical protein F4801DRAFT_578977 [Xylaria longipes]
MTEPRTNGKKKILLTGIKTTAEIPPFFRDQFGTADEITAKLERDLARTQRNGFDCKPYQIDPNDAEVGLQGMEDELKSSVYEGVMIGAGVRLVPEQTHLFEKMVDVCRRVAPNIPFMFNSGPDTHCQALERAFGIKMEE